MTTSEMLMAYDNQELTGKFLADYVNEHVIPIQGMTWPHARETVSPKGKLAIVSCEESHETHSCKPKNA